MKLSKLKRRLRKKYHAGEFQEFGFEIVAHLTEGLKETEFDKFASDFILEAIEKNYLMFSGGVIKKNGKGLSVHQKNIVRQPKIKEQKLTIG